MYRINPEIITELSLNIRKHCGNRDENLVVVSHLPSSGMNSFEACSVERLRRIDTTRLPLYYLHLNFPWKCLGGHQ